MSDPVNSAFALYKAMQKSDDALSTQDTLTSIAAHLKEIEEKDRHLLAGHGSLSSAYAHFKDMEERQNLNLKAASSTQDTLTSIAAHLKEIEEKDRHLLAGHGSLSSAYAHFKDMEERQNLKAASSVQATLTSIAAHLKEIEEKDRHLLAGHGSLSSAYAHFKDMEERQNLKAASSVQATLAAAMANFKEMEEGNASNFVKAASSVSALISSVLTQLNQTEQGYSPQLVNSHSLAGAIGAAQAAAKAEIESFVDYDHQHRQSGHPNEDLLHGQTLSQVQLRNLDKIYSIADSAQDFEEEIQLQPVTPEQLGEQLKLLIQSNHDELKEIIQKDKSISAAAIRMFRDIVIGLIVNLMWLLLLSPSQTNIATPPFKIQQTPYQQTLPNNELPSSLRFTNRYEASIYSSKGIKSDIVDSVYLGQPLKIIQKQKNWSQVEYISEANSSTESGWILTRYTTRPSMSRTVYRKS